MFISFEGIEASGKSTQVSLLSNYLSSQGKKVQLLKEPGGTLLGEQICHMVKSLDAISSVAELFLFSASRIELTKKIIKPKLEASEFIICDRYCDSTTAYQGYGRELSLNLISQLNSIATDGISPHKTILIDISVKESFKRLNNRSKTDYIEKENQLFHERVRQGFLKIAQKEKNRFIVIDGLQDQELIHQSIIRNLNL